MAQASNFASTANLQEPSITGGLVPPFIIYTLCSPAANLSPVGRSLKQDFTPGNKELPTKIKQGRKWKALV
jgi:hypothetical protein